MIPGIFLTIFSTDPFSMVLTFHAHRVNMRTVSGPIGTVVLFHFYSSCLTTLGIALLTGHLYLQSQFPLCIIYMALLGHGADTELPTSHLSPHFSASSKIHTKDL